MPKFLYHESIATPWTIKIELVHGCNLKCKFCPVSLDDDLQNKATREFISLEILEKFCVEYADLREANSPNSWPRIELAQRGEPTLHPHLFKCLRIIRKHLPKCQITLFTNGVMVLKDEAFIGKVFDAGLNVLYIDCYNDTYQKFESHCNQVNDGSFQVYDAKDFSPYRIHKGGHNLSVVSLIVGLEDQENSLSVREIHNVGGNMPPESLVQFGWEKKEDLPLQKNCYRPYRDIVMLCDGNIVVCCLDWYPTEDTILGNVNEESVEEIWYGENHLSALRALWNKNRDWGLCKTCDYFGGYRLGLLQNPNIEKG